MSGKLDEADRQAMIRAYAKQYLLSNQEAQMSANNPYPTWLTFQETWLTAMRYGMEQSAQICESNKLTETHIGPLFNAGWSGAITSCAAAITAAMQAKEGE